MGIKSGRLQGCNMGSQFLPLVELWYPFSPLVKSSISVPVFVLSICRARAMCACSEAPGFVLDRLFVLVRRCIFLEGGANLPPCYVRNL